jgi:hypothetical protein
LRITKFPAEFRFAVYERLVERVRESGAFAAVYRSGDRNGCRRIFSNRETRCALEARRNTGATIRCATLYNPSVSNFRPEEALDVLERCESDSDFSGRGVLAVAGSMEGHG